MITQSGIEYKIGQMKHFTRQPSRVWTLICKATDGQEFEIELGDEYDCICCLPFGQILNREITESEITDVLTDFNS